MFVPHSEFDVAEGSQPLEETANAANAPIIDDPPLVRRELILFHHHLKSNSGMCTWLIDKVVGRLCD
ncbi:hypothetical protein HanRHA438_Chr11g0504301 [Helianthus annuus]|nr:hypothetical protein HanHA300_Chr11g0402901 [Helianthus annuus]KAJ0509472.1 hypothetical protein HanIR_Chr11g0529221 [Helianthus annuus]KAJ0517532.1 hypothetical protein HanHA89_Chr11g0426411 [Helianthus annuus]KAJ0685542.1 hypothetical protein HanLR1_Chr11g0403851 [Helianthus annuus]KAJ0689436.1 hypothetical protein HanOQP8_Chr11g0405681 [Helianthus annuus]